MQIATAEDWNASSRFSVLQRLSPPDGLWLQVPAVTDYAMLCAILLITIELPNEAEL